MRIEYNVTVEFIVGYTKVYRILENGLPFAVKKFSAIEK
jgi:hypothetical protein